MVYIEVTQNTQLNAMKLYTVDKPIPNWVHEHKEDIYRDVLIQCEEKLLNPDGINRVEVALLKTEAGITKFIIKDVVGILDSLERSMLYFAEVEQYNLAARSRDCIKNWKKINITCQ